MNYLFQLLSAVVIGGIVIVLFNFISAFTATILGDDTPKNNGQLSLNPIKHIEPFGFILFVLIGYGWSNMIETRPSNFKDRKKGTILTYSMPIIVSILLAIVINSLAKFIPNPVVGGNHSLAALYLIPSMFAHTLLQFALINIIPVYPLFGSNVLKACLKPNTAMSYTQKERIIQIIILFLMFLGINVAPIDAIVNLILG